MTRRLWLTLALSLTGCRGHDHHGDEGHGHPHAHGGEGDELPSQSVTIWTERNELFMEYAPLVVGQESRFAAHVTALPTFKAATAGTVTVRVRMADGSMVEARADAPTSPGIFRPTLAPTAPGKCEMTLSIEREGARDLLPIEGCEVFPDGNAARSTLTEHDDPPGRITYLKEQAWKTEYANQPVAERDLQPSVRANGEIRPVAGKEARLTAPVTGRVVLAAPVPVLGMPVRKGQLLASLAPRVQSAGDRAGLEAEVQTAQAELTAAESQLSRAERLFAEQAIPEKQLDEARTRVQVAKAQLAGAQGRVEQYVAGASGTASPGQGAFRIRAPLDGTLVAVSATSGQNVEEGDPLFVVIDLSRIWLEARIFEPDIPRVDNARAAWFAIDGYEDRFTVDTSNGKLVTIGHVIDPQTRTVPVVFELVNPEGKLRIGQFADVWIAMGAPFRALAIPESAIIDDAGQSVAFVQVEGEAFERRPLTLGVRSLGWVEVTGGLVAGERVVTKGAYEIKLASAAGAIPAHGHAH